MCVSALFTIRFSSLNKYVKVTHDTKASNSLIFTGRRTLNTSVVTQKAQQCLYIVRRLNLKPPCYFQSSPNSTEESSRASLDHKTLLKRSSGSLFHHSQAFSTPTASAKALNTVEYPSHLSRPSRGLFTVLLSGKRYRGILTNTTSLCNRFNYTGFEN